MKKATWVPSHPSAPELHSGKYQQIVEINRGTLAAGPQQLVAEPVDHRNKPCIQQVELSTYVALVKECGNAGSLAEAKRLHARIKSSPHSRNNFLGNLLVAMYGKCGSADDARAVFEGISQRNVFSWTMMIVAYAQNGHSMEALEMFRKMELEGVQPDDFALVAVLDACGDLGALTEAKAFHARILDKSDVVVATALINIFRKCGSLDEAKKMFESMESRNVPSWNVMIGAYAQNGYGANAFCLLFRMQQEGVMPGKATLLSMLDACSTAPRQFQAVYSCIANSGLESEVVVGSALVHFYGKIGRVKDAKMAFDRIQQKNMISWTAMLGAYVHNEHGKEAIELFRQMDLEGLKPDKICYVTILEAFTDQEIGRAMHSRIVENGYESDVVVGTALLKMHAKFGNLEEARRIFDRMQCRNVVSWNAMIAAYAQLGHNREALKLFQVLQQEGVKPNESTFVSAIDACTGLAAIAQAKMIHLHAVGTGLDSDLGNALLHMYASCSSLEDARSMFGEMRAKGVVSWSSMIAAYSQHGCGMEAIELFEQMQQEGVEPNWITFVSVLCACGHVGLVEKALSYFVSLRDDHGIRATREHYHCMVDVLGRAGWLDEADELMKSLPFQPGVVTWMTLLGACRIHSNAKLGAYSAKRAVELDPGNSMPLVLLSNIYSMG